MTLDHFADENASNKYCKRRNLRNERDVEHLFLVPLLDELGFTEDYRESQETIKEITIGKGKTKKNYHPDFVCYSDRDHLRPLLIVDAKHPLKNAEEGVGDAQLYTAVMRRKLDEPKPIQYCLGSNGLHTVVKHYEREIAEFDLVFADFVNGNQKFERLKTDMNRDVRAKSLSLVSASQLFEFRKPDTNEIKGIFEACHKIIWRREFESPVPAFWEFCKLMFIKLNEDKHLRSDPQLKELIEAGKPLPREKVIFSSYYINSHQHGDPNPIASLFRQFRDDFETKVLSGEKKRIFDTNEEIELEPLTIKQVVELLEHHDLIKIDEDLNGRLFQTFLSATMRGKGLGQFFTPRTVVEFMVDLAEMKLSDKPPYAPFIIDACCGTGGFLIESMAKLVHQLRYEHLSKTLSEEALDTVEKSIKDDHLFGIDAGKTPPIARIARINMYLHGDGGSRIWFSDALDKRVRIQSTLNPELRAEKKGLQNIIVKEKMKFDIALTNPPFSMKKREIEADQRAILQDYRIREYADKDGVKKVKSSLKSNVMFLERYHDLLKDEGGILISVIDESVLNTDTDKIFRDWMLRNYYVKAIISLPQDTFAEAGANVKTSILYMVKKAHPSDDQPHTFYARSDNVGYDGIRLDETKSDLPKILDQYFKFKSSGDVLDPAKNDWSAKSKFFVKKLTPNMRRIDFEWFDPRHDAMDKILKQVSKEKSYKIETIGDLVSRGVCSMIKGKTAGIYVSEGVPIIKLRNVINDGVIWRGIDHVLRSFFDDNQDRHLRKGDILVTSTGVGTIGRVTILDKDIDCMTDGHVTTIRIIDKTKISPDYLAHYLRSIFGQMQMERYTVGSTGQTELNDPDVTLMKVIYPEDIEEQRNILKMPLHHEEFALKSRANYHEYVEKSKQDFLKGLTT